MQIKYFILADYGKNTSKILNLKFFFLFTILILYDKINKGEIMVIKDLVDEVTLKNREGRNLSSGFETRDKVFFDLHDDVKNPKFAYRRVSPTDYARYCGAKVSLTYEYGAFATKFTDYFLRDTIDRCIVSIDADGQNSLTNGSVTDVSCCPVMRVNSKKLKKLKNVYINEEKDEGGNVKYYTIELGEFPKSAVDFKLVVEFEKNLSMLQKTGKTYTGTNLSKMKNISTMVKNMSASKPVI